MSLCSYMEDISLPFNTQDQSPDDSYTLDHRGAPCIFFDIPHKGSQVFPRLLTKQDISHFFLQLVSQDSTQELFKHTISPYLVVSWIEFQFCCLWIRFVSQGVVCFHSVDFGVTPRIASMLHVFSSISHTKTVKCLHTKQDISHFFLQLVSHDSVQELFKHTISPYLGVSRIEFQFCYLWIRFVSQGVVCFHSVGFGGHTQDNQYAPCIFVDNPLKDSQVLTRVHTKQVISHFSIVTRPCTGTLSTYH